MSRDEYSVAAAAVNGRPQRLVTVDRKDGVCFRDHINSDSARSRKNYIRAAASKFSMDEAEFDWLDDAIVSAADDADATAEALVDIDDHDVRKSQATQLVELAESATLFRDLEGEAFARISVGDHLEVVRIRSKAFRRWMARLFYVAIGKAASSQAMQDAIGVLEGKAVFEGETRPVFVRLAEMNGCIYLDLCDPDWRVIEISAGGWQVLTESPVMFRRAKAMLPLPLPVLGGEFDELRQFVQMSDDEWPLFAGWLVATLRPVGPYPVLNLQGEHGSGKSTTCRMARSLVDPNTAMLRSEPREPRDLMIAANNGWMLAFDNLSGIQAWQSDCLCRMSTGGGFSTRTLYENDEETIFDAQRPVLINGIEEIASRSDLLDRCLLLNLPRIERCRRRPEAELWTAFEAARPRILGALLSAVSVAIRNLKSTTLEDLPRMADFALWATAAESGLGIEPTTFIEAYHANRHSGNEIALEASPVGRAVTQLIAGVGEWSGTSTDLLGELDGRADEKTRFLKTWPKSARALSGAIKRLAPNLRTAGIGIDFHRHGHQGSKVIWLRWESEEQRGISASAPSAASAASNLTQFDDSADASRFEPASAEESGIVSNWEHVDATDDADADFQDLSW